MNSSKEQSPQRNTEGETWEDTIAMLRAGAPPTEVLPNIRALLRGLPDPPTPEPPSIPKTPTSHLYHTINGKLFQIPYLRAPTHLWRLLAERGDDTPIRLFDGELHVDVLELFQPRFVHPPSENIREELQRVDCETGKLSIVAHAVMENKEWTEDDLQQFADKLSVLQVGEKIGIPNLSEEEWACVISMSDFELTLPFASQAVRTVNQPEFSRIILASVLPLLAQDEETNLFIEVVSTTVALSKLDEMPAGRLVEILAPYENLGALGALAQVQIVCRRY